MINNVFDIRRFALLCRKEWLECWKGKLLIRVIAPVLAFVVIMCWDYYMDCKSGLRSEDLGQWAWSANSSLVVMAFLLFSAYAILITSQLMKRVGERKSRVSWLLTPASALEKFLVSMLGVLISIFVIFPLALAVEEVVRVCVFSSAFPELPVKFIQYSQIVGDGSPGSYGILAFNRDAFYYEVLIAVGVFAVFVLGSSLWPKNSVVYTLVACVLLFIGFSGLMNVWVGLIYPGDWQTVNEISDTMLDRDWVLLSWHMRWQWGRFFLYGMIPFCIILAYYRFKELEIINRW